MAGFHQRLRRELLDPCGPFADLVSAQAAVDGWLEDYYRVRPHQTLDIAVPVRKFAPKPQASPSLRTGAGPEQREPARHARLRESRRRVNFPGNCSRSSIGSRVPPSNRAMTSDDSTFGLLSCWGPPCSANRVG
ncbi:integrase core domain-containing protein [Streptomyces flaveus]|uniref:integrase core domain-containing protein n=1 Tax=Streptomyces flaveus TaxID=66370 RepID=UPI003D9E350C